MHLIICQKPFSSFFWVKLLILLFSDSMMFWKKNSKTQKSKNSPDFSTWFNQEPEIYKDF